MTSSDSTSNGTIVGPVTAAGQEELAAAAERREYAGVTDPDGVPPARRDTVARWALLGRCVTGHPVRAPRAVLAVKRAHGVRDDASTDETTAAQAADQRTRAEQCTAYLAEYARLMRADGVTTDEVTGYEPQPAPHPGAVVTVHGWSVPVLVTATTDTDVVGIITGGHDARIPLHLISGTPTPGTDRAAEPDPTPVEGLGDTAALIQEGPDAAAFRVEHMLAGGTAVHGSSTGDGVWQILQTYGRPGTWDGHLYLRNTRNKPADPARVRAIAAAIATHTGEPVRVVIDNRARSVAELDAERASRVADRVDRLQERAGRAYTTATDHREQAEKLTEGIATGQPILEGHHSETKHRNTLEKSDRIRRKGWAAGDQAARLQSRAAGAAATEEAKSDPRAMIRRRERLEEEERALLRRHTDAGEPHPDSIDGARLTQLREEIALITARLDELATSGEFVAWTRDDFRPGDLVNVGGHWHRLIRANAKSVTVPWWGSHTPDTDTKGDTAPYDKVHGRRRDGWQLDTPAGTPWPVSDAVRVARWNTLTSRAARPFSEPEERTNRTRVRLTERLVYALPADAADAQVEAYRLKDTRPHRQRALEAHAVFERLAAGETFAAIAASITAAAVAPVWTMPAGQPVDVRVDQLQRGDILAGFWEHRGPSRDLIRYFCGPVAWVSAVQDRRERGSWVTVRLNGGEEREFKTHAWFAAYPAGQPTVRVAELTGGERVDVRGRDQFSKPTRLAGHLAGAPSQWRETGATAHPMLALTLSEHPGGWNGWRGQVFVELDAWCAVLPAEQPAPVDALTLAREAGAGAYTTGRPRAAGADATVRELIAGLAVGTGAAEIMQAFLDGYDDVGDQAAAQVLAGR